MEFIEKYREDGSINVSQIIAENNLQIEIEQRGARRKFWFANYQYLFKSLFENSYEDYAEVISTRIAKYFGIPCAEYDFATYNGEKGVVTKNFVAEEEGEELVSGKEIIEYVTKNYIDVIDFACTTQRKQEKLDLTTATNAEKKSYIEKMLTLAKMCNIDYKYSSVMSRVIADESAPDYSKRLDDMYEQINEIYDSLYETYKDIFKKRQDESFAMQANNLFDLWSMIDIYIKKNGLGDEKTSIALNNSLYNIFIYDMLTLQGDRHPDNWGLIVNRKKGTVRMAPIFDNSNIFNLNRSKTINNMDTEINSVKKEKSPNKKERMQERIKRSIYHPKPRLGIDSKRSNDYLKQATELVKQYSGEDLKALEKKLTDLDENVISFIFADIQSTTRKQIPDIVKNIVSESIKMNRDSILTIINDSKGERSVEETNAKNS